MRLRASVFLCGLWLLVMAAGLPVSAGTLSGSEDTVSAGQTTVTAQVMAEETLPAEEESDSPDETTSAEEETNLPGEKASESETSDSELPNHEVQSGVRTAAVNTADPGTWEYMLLLLVFGGIVFMALKSRRRY